MLKDLYFERFFGEFIIIHMFKAKRLHFFVVRMKRQSVREFFVEQKRKHSINNAAAAKMVWMLLIVNDC